MNQSKRLVTVVSGVLVIAFMLTGYSVVAAEDYAVKLGFEKKTYTTKDGRSMLFCQKLMNQELPGKPALLLVFHGAGERGNNNFSQLIGSAEQIDGYLKRNPMKILLLYPQCPEKTLWVDTPWSLKKHTMKEQPSENMKLVLEILDAKTVEFEVDLDRIYVSGLSMGGFGTWDIISRRPDYFAAALPICGGADLKQAEKLAKLPITVYHGDRDREVFTVRSDSMVEALRKAGNTQVIYHRIFNTGHGVWGMAYGDSATLDWLFSHKRGRAIQTNRGKTLQEWV